MTRIVIVGAGRGGTALLELFAGDPSVHLLGMVDINEHAPGMERARALGIPTATDYKEFLRESAVDLIVDVTGNPEVSRTLWQLKPESAELMGGTTAKFLWSLIEERHRKAALERDYKLMLRELRFLSGSEFILGANPRMREVAELIMRVAPTPTTVLVRGESGTGKELVARAIHQNSHLKDRPLVTVNCTALSPTLMESELFGHRKGAFTGAVKDKLGLFEKANGGTIFLDEIGDMSLEMQAKLLRVLQTGEVKAVGDVATKRVKVRIIAATNRDLEGALAKGEFREDLIYRLNTFTITLPPLRERTEDIPILAHHFLRKAEAKVNKKIERIAPDALEMLQKYPWPGNLRELENIIERAVVLAPARIIEAGHLPLHVQQESRGTPDLEEGFGRAKERVISTFEREAITRYLQQTGGNISRAAMAGGMTRRTFHRLLAKHGISHRQFKPAR